MSTKKEYGKDKRFVINMATGSHGFRTEITDTLPTTFKIITDATCEALCKGKVKGSEVVAAIKKGFMSPFGKNCYLLVRISLVSC